LGKLPELRHNFPGEFLNLFCFFQQQVNGATQGPKEFIPVERSSQCVRRGVPHFLRKKIEATAVVCGQAAPSAREAQCVVSHAANPVLCLPKSTAFDAEPGPQRMMHCIAEELVRVRGLHMRLLYGFAKNEPELWAECAEVGRWRKGQIELKAAWQ
jgi:hypothetical protein